MRKHQRGHAGRIALALSFGIALIGQNASAGKMYKIDGEITKLTPETIVVRQGAELFELSRDATDERSVPKDAKVGDHVTVFYTMDVHKMTKKPGQKAGEAPLKPVPMPDDRLFYDAKNSGGSGSQS